MELFAIFLCIVIGHTFGDVQRVEIGKDDLKANEHVMEAVSLEAKDTGKPLEVKRSLPRTSAATQTTDTAISVKARRLFRKKRAKEDPFAGFRKTVNVYQILTTPLLMKIFDTSHADERVAKSCMATSSIPPNILADYEAVRNQEREMFKKKLAEAPDAPLLIDTYTSMRNSTGWKKLLTYNANKDFFDKPSPGQAVYEKFRQSDFASLDGFIREVSSDKAQNNLKATKTEEAERQNIEKPKAPEAEVATTQSVYTPKSQDAEVATTQSVDTPKSQDAEVATTQPNEISKSQEAKPEKVRKIDPTKVVAVSYSVMQYFLNKLPSVLNDKCLITDDAEKVVLENYVKSQSVPTEALDAYNSAKKEERELLKRLLTEVPRILPTYKSLRKGVAWNHTRLNDKFREFFQQPSTALKQYEDLKRDEMASLDSFLGEKSPAGTQEITKNTETEEARKGKKEEAGKGKNEEAGKGKNEEAGKEKADDAEKRETTVGPDTTKGKEAEKGKIEAVKRTESEIDKTAKSAVVEKDRNADGKGTTERGDIPYCGPNKPEIKVDINGAEKEEILNAHNDERLSEEATNMFRIVWDDELARIAQYKANNCGYFHSDLRNCNNSNISQNLYADWAYTNATPMIYLSVNYRQVIKVWADERKDWDWTTLTCAPKKMCGHWLTLTGAASRRIGCGRAACPKMEVFGEIRDMANLVVCDYLPSSLSYERGTHCSHCRSSTAQLGEDERGHSCHNDMCVPCDIRTNEMCRCGRPDSCQNGGKFSTKICRCNCTREYDGPLCATRALTIQGRRPA